MSALAPFVRRMLRDDRAQYVAINLFVNLLFLVRGYVFMLALDYRDLGLVSLVQSIVLLLSLLQFGVLSGGYRLLLSDEAGERRQIVNFVYSFIAVLTSLCLMIAGAALLVIEPTSDAMIGLFGVIGGGASLMRNWQINQMIAASRLTTLNAINFGSAMVSLLPFAFLSAAPLEACVATIVLQPVLFALAAWAGGPAHRPLAFALPVATGRRIMAAGFLVFLSGMLLQVNVQIERWYVTSELGVEALGHLFLAIMFVTVLQLVPNALNAIFLPPAVTANSNGDASRMSVIMRQYLGLLLAYTVVAGLAVWLLARPVVALLAPLYLPDLYYVYLIAPGALLLAVSGAFALWFVVTMRYRAMITAYGIGTAALSAVVVLALIADAPLSLAQLMIARSAALGLTAFGVIAGWWLLSREYRGLRFFSRKAHDD